MIILVVMFRVYTLVKQWCMVLKNIQINRVAITIIDRLRGYMVLKYI